MKKISVILCCILFTCAVTGCSGYDWEAEEEGLEPVDLNSVEELYHIRITAGDTELGSLAYWYDGPSVALIYKTSREETVVPVVPMGKITSDVSFLQEYEERITIELEEGALDLARAVRFVRKNAKVYGIDEKDIAVMGFSAGGILAGEMLLNFDGLVNGTALDGDYLPDSLDEISSDAAADGMIYSFYGRLSAGSTDVEMLRAGNLPPTFYCYGTRDPFYSQFLANAEAVEAAGVQVGKTTMLQKLTKWGSAETLEVAVFL